MLGYAVTDRGVINLRTVSDSEYAAAVNGLAILFECWMTEAHEPERVMQLWDQYEAKHPNLKIVPVSVTVSPDHPHPPAKERRLDL